MSLSEEIELGYDIVVVGAGAAGCSFADSISEDYKVLIIDSANFPRHKTCSGILVLESKSFLGDLPKKCLLKPEELDIEYIDVDNKKNKLVKKEFLNSDRFLLDEFLFNKIKAKRNITFVEKSRLVEFNEAQDREHLVLLIDSGGEVKSIVSKYIIGCDGALSIVRKKITTREIPFYVGIKEYLKSSKQIEKAYFIFDEKVTDFYSWVIPKGKYVEVGSLLLPVGAKNKFFNFKKEMKFRFGLIGRGKIESAIVFRPSSIKDIILGKKNIFLCGEAAGLISPSSAEGISYALISGDLCAKAFNSKKGDVLKKYSNSAAILIKRLEKKIIKSKLISDKDYRLKLFY